MSITRLPVAAAAASFTSGGGAAAAAARAGGWGVADVVVAVAARGEPSKCPWVTPMPRHALVAA